MLDLSMNSSFSTTPLLAGQCHTIVLAVLTTRWIVPVNDDVRVCVCACARAPFVLMMMCVWTWKGFHLAALSSSQPDSGYEFVRWLSPYFVNSPHVLMLANGTTVLHFQTGAYFALCACTIRAF